MNKLCAQPSGMINCRGGKNDTLLRDFVCHCVVLFPELRGLTGGIFKLGSLVFRVREK